MSDGCEECGMAETVPHWPLCETCYARAYQQWREANGGHIPKGNKNGEI